MSSLRAGAGTLRIQETPQGITFEVKVTPRAQRNQIAGTEGNLLRIKIAAPPVEGRANEELVRFLASTFGVARADVEILRGHNARLKLVRVRGVSAIQVKAVLEVGDGPD